MKKAKAILCLALVLIMLASCGQQAAAPAASAPAGEKTTREPMRIAVIPTVVHPWFYDVYLGSQAEAEWLSKEVGYEIKVDYYAPEHGEITEQIALIEQVAATQPDGLIICPLEVSALTPVVEELKSRGIAIGLINYKAPDEWQDVIGCANDFEDQGIAAAKLVVEATGGKGKVAVMHGVPGTTHNSRYDGIMKYLADYPDLEIIEAGYGKDDFTLSSELASATIAANPDLQCFTCVDATAPTAIANAVREANKVGDITVIGMETTDEILEAIKDGTMECTVSSKADLQGRALLLNVWQKICGIDTIRFADTGIDIINKDNVDKFIKQ